MKKFTFDQVFYPHHNKKSDQRGKYLSRLFGIFSEDIVRIWSRLSKSRYENIGRPTIMSISEAKIYTLDFTFRHKENNKVYIVEMKCEIEYENYKYMTLRTPEQLDHHKNKAFRLFLDAAEDKSKIKVFVERKPIDIEGVILIWGDATNDGRIAVRNKHGIHEVLTIQDMINDLLVEGSEEYRQYITDRKTWNNEFFEDLISL